MKHRRFDSYLTHQKRHLQQLFNKKLACDFLKMLCLYAEVAEWQTRQVQALVLRSRGSSPLFRIICSNSSVGQNTRLIIVKSKVRLLLTAPICGFNSAGRVSDLHSESHRFEPCNPHQKRVMPRYINMRLWWNWQTQWTLICSLRK